MTSEPESIDPSELTLDQMREVCWQAGNLSYLVLPHQRDVYDAFWAWQATKHKRSVRLAWARAGLLYHHAWHWEIARRWGKTVLAMLIVIEFCIRRPGSTGLLCTAFQNSIAEIILKILRTVFEPDAPPGYCPIYRSSKGGEHELLWIPAVNSTIKLVGLDKHSDKTRGNFQDFCVVTEAGFVGLGKLLETYTGPITPQFRYRPWAWAIMESSTSPIPGHEFQTTFKRDAIGRGCHVLRTIEQSDLTPEEIELELAVMGGKDSSMALREAYCIIAVDETRAVVPEFSESRHVLDASELAPPEYAIALTCLDPGTRDRCGIVWAYVDFLHARIVVQAAYAESNKNTAVIARQIRETELRLWGTALELVPQDETRRLADTYKPERLMSGPRHPPAQQTIGQATRQPGGATWRAPAGALTWWDDEARSLQPNPWRRISDVQAQMQLDLAELHQLHFESADKTGWNVQRLSSQRIHVNLLRVLCQQDRLRIVRCPETEPLIRQLSDGRWNEKHTDFEKSPELGHLDTVMALAYGARRIDWALNPYRPEHVDPHAPDVIVPEEYRRKVMLGEQTPKYQRGTKRRVNR